MSFMTKTEYQDQRNWLAGKLEEQKKKIADKAIFFGQRQYREPQDMANLLLDDIDEAIDILSQIDAIDRRWAEQGGTEWKNSPPEFFCDLCRVRISRRGLCSQCESAV